MTNRKILPQTVIVSFGSGGELGEGLGGEGGTGGEAEV